MTINALVKTVGLPAPNPLDLSLARGYAPYGADGLRPLSQQEVISWTYAQVVECKPAVLKRLAETFLAAQSFVVGDANGKTLMLLATVQGFLDSANAAIKHGLDTVTLVRWGTRVLRSETAGVALTAAVTQALAWEND